MYINEPYNFYLLRSPSYSLNSLHKLNELLNNYSISECQALLKPVFADELFIEAIFLSSRVLHNTLKQWISGNLNDEKKVENLVYSLHKYYTRMCTRCTPYGMLSGCSSGNVITGKTNINFNDRKLIRFSRLDMGLAGQIVRQLEQVPSVRNHIKFYLNSSLYLINGKYRYVEYVYKGTARQYSLAALRQSFLLDIVSQVAITGITKQQLVLEIRKNSKDELVAEDVDKFIENLINYQFLVSEIDLRVTEGNYIDFVLEKLKLVKNVAPQISTLVDVQNLLKGNISGVDTYLEVEKKLSIFDNINADSLIQTDLFYNHSNQINQNIINEITQTAEELSVLSDLYVIKPLEEFKKEFQRRYDRQEVAFTLALDAEFGIGYGNAINGNIENLPLISGLYLPGEQSIQPLNVKKLSFKKYKEHCKSGEFTVKITSDELLEIEKIDSNNNSTFSTFIMGSLLSSSTSELDAGNYQFDARKINTPFAGKIPARFTIGNEELKKQVTTCLEDEQNSNPNVIFAEILHVPDDRMCNIIVRPAFREYEIPYLCNTAKDNKSIININDLTLSIREGKLILKSKLLGKEIIPRLTNSHNSSMSISPYKFLCDLQYQNINTEAIWNWGSLLNEPFLPRVTYKKFVISRARWLLQKLSLSEQKEAAKDLKSYFYKLKTSLNIKNLVVIQEFDNELLIDFDNVVCQHHLFQKLKQKNVVLLEFLPKLQNCFIDDKDENSYANEIVIPVKKMSLISMPIRKNPINNQISLFTLQRDFAPGSNWLYVKIYASNNILEQVLVTKLMPIISDLLITNNITKWFFIKYNDPNSHIRIRFFSENEQELISIVWSSLYKVLGPLIHDESISNVCLDTYRREIERYGSETMMLSESLFWADSNAIGKVLKIILQTGNEQLRWLAGICSIDSLLNVFAYDNNSKLNIIKQIKESFFKEFNNNLDESQSGLNKSLNDKYRIDSTYIKLFFNVDGNDQYVESIKNIFQVRSLETTEIALAIKSCLTQSLEGKLDNILMSYIHMTMNRLFITRQRTHELVLYHYLFKYYTTIIKKGIL